MLKKTVSTSKKTIYVSKIMKYIYFINPSFISSFCISDKNKRYNMDRVSYLRIKRRIGTSFHIFKSDFDR